MNTSQYISYAQNAEDVILNRIFPKERGFYIDVGAGFPTYDSVTKNFYDKGWRGINVEPQSDIFKVLKKKRRKDINIQAAISNTNGKATLTKFNSAWGWATLANKYPNPLNFRTKKITVKTFTLNKVLEKYNIKDEIDFLKVDVEGEEETVIRSINLKKWKPKVLILEVVTQTQDLLNYVDFEKYLKENGYQYCLFDGINRYYVRKDLKDIIRKMKAPANCLDNYIPARALIFIEDEKLRELYTAVKNPALQTFIKDKRKLVSEMKYDK